MAGLAFGLSSLFFANNYNYISNNISLKDENMDKIKIKPNTKIAKLDAAFDEKFLENCFQDNGFLDELVDCSESESIILGRTGAGKTAGLIRIDNTTDNSKFLDLEDISLRFVDNSNVIPMLDELGVNLNLFYRYLWRHILSSELLKLKYPDWDSGKTLANYLGDLFTKSKSPEEESAIQYLKEWSDTYWMETEENLKEIINIFDATVQSELSTGINSFSSKLNAGSNISNEERVEIVNRATKVVNDVQIAKLSKIVGLLDSHVFVDNKQNYYILIDKLDENWTSSNIKYRLIRSLIEEIKYFHKVKNVKIIISLRVDLFLITLDETRDSGFQEDKIRSLIHKIQWDEISLKELVNSRVQYVFEHKYTKARVNFDDLLPTPLGKGGDPWDYIIQRTFLRPRDVLQFVNHCFDKAINKTKIDWTSILAAEKEYSQERLSSLYEEWLDIYPSLEILIPLVSGIDEIFSRDEIVDKYDWPSKLVDVYGNLKRYESKDKLASLVIKFWDEKAQSGSTENIDYIFNEVLSCFYRTGILGLSNNRPDNFDWSFINSSYKTALDCSRAKYFKVHKMFHHVLHVKQT